MAFNALMGALAIGDEKVETAKKNDTKPTATPKSPPQPPPTNIISKFSKVLPPLPSPALLPSFTSLLIFRFINTSTYNLSVKDYHFNRYGIQRSSMGYYSSYGSVISLVTNLFVLAPVVNMAKRR